MRVLVAVEDYVGEGRPISHKFVHVRNLYYKIKGIDVTVLNFSSDIDYEYEGIRVITIKTYCKVKNDFDILLCHQPNIKHHFRFLKMYGHNFKHFIFFFHGHEVLKVNKAYSQPYDFMKKSKLRSFIQDIYDDFKLAVWRSYYPSVVSKSTFVFVSAWMLEEFLKWTKIPFDVIKNNYKITYNCIGQAFEETVFDCSSPKTYDFITIRNSLDGSKYCIDLINKLAIANPNLKFLLVGKGTIFNHIKKANNIIWVNKTMDHKEITEILQKARCALMLTRTDAQGLMMCELASTGMPLITSDIPVCHEIFGDFKNVVMISNSDTKIDLNIVLNKLEKQLPFDKKNNYFNENTSQAEVELILNVNS